MDEVKSKKSIVINVPTAQINFSPHGFLRYAKEYLKAAGSIIDSDNFSPIPYYLYCHSIELSLKAYLSTEGYTLKKLKSCFGHDLNKLINTSIQEGLILPAAKESIKLVDQVNHYYKNKQFEYFFIQLEFKEFRNLPNIHDLENLATEIINGIEQKVLSYR